MLQGLGYVICQICESYHDSIEELNAHYERDHPTGNKKNMTSDGKYKCEFCEMRYTQRSSMYTHQREKHGRAAGRKRKTNQGTVPCSICGKLFYDKAGVYKHTKTAHKR